MVGCENRLERVGLTLRLAGQRLTLVGMVLDALGDGIERNAHGVGRIAGQQLQSLLVEAHATTFGQGVEEPVAVYLQHREVGRRWNLDRRGAGGVDVAGKARQGRTGDARAERLGRDALEVVGLVDDQDVVLRQDHRLATTGRAQRQIGEVERVIDQHDLAPRRPLAREFGVAAVALGAADAAATIGTDRQLAPDGLGGHHRQLVTIALTRADEPLIQPRQLGLKLLRHALMCQRSLHAAHVVRASLYYSGGDVEPRRLPGERQILVEQLALQRLRRGRDDDPATAQRGRHEVGEALADTRRRLRHEDATRIDAVTDLLRKA